MDEIEAYREQVKQMKEKIASPVHIPNSNTTSANSEQKKLISADKSASSDSGMQGIDLEAEPPDLLEKLKTAMQQKEFWALEYQLLKMKYERISRVYMIFITYLVYYKNLHNIPDKHTMNLLLFRNGRNVKISSKL